MTKKSISTRFKVTKNGKVLHRKMGQGHFRAKRSSKQLGRIKLISKSSGAIKKIVTKTPGKS